MHRSPSNNIGWSCLLMIVASLAGCGKERPAIEAPIHFAPKPMHPPVGLQDAQNSADSKTTIEGKALSPTKAPNTTGPDKITPATQSDSQAAAADAKRKNMSSQSIHSPRLEPGK
jgi:hypothetical protein